MAEAIEKKLGELAGPDPAAGRGGRGGGGGGRGGPAGPAGGDSFGSIAGQFLPIMNILQDADAAPTSQAAAATNARLKTFAELKAKWVSVVNTDIAALNVKLKAAGAQPVTP